MGTLRSTCRELRTTLNGINALIQSVCRWLLDQKFTGACFSSRDFSARVDRLLKRHGDIVVYREHYSAWFLLQVRFKQWVTEQMKDRFGFVDCDCRRPDLRSTVGAYLVEVSTLLRSEWQHVVDLDSATLWDTRGGGGSLECPSLDDIEL